MIRGTRVVATFNSSKVPFVIVQEVRVFGILVYRYGAREC